MSCYRSSRLVLMICCIVASCRQYGSHAFAPTPSLPKTRQSSGSISNNSKDIIGSESSVDDQPSQCYTSFSSSTRLYSHLKNKCDKSITNTPLQLVLKKLLVTTLTLFTLATTSLPTYAADYGSLTPEQKLVAEAWRLVDNSYLDRTFNGQDWFKVRQDYVKDKKIKTMEQAQEAIEQITSSLGDKYTRYLSPAKYQSIVDSATGTLAGVGVQISTSTTSDGASSGIIASDVEDNSPAQQAGIKPNDYILEADGVKFTDSKTTPDDVALVLRGPPGSKVGITLRHPGDNEPYDVIVTRQPLQITAVKSYTNNVNGVGNVGVVRIKNFSGTTAKTVAEQVEDLINNKKVKVLVLDLRGNPGGLLPGGVETASLFLDANKPVVFTVSNRNSIVDRQDTLAPGINLDTPLIVLVDGNTASAAEVFTAALQENDHRATIVGQNTFGKGIVQTIRELTALPNAGGLAITVARYETPLHNNINQRGIKVDVETSVDCPKDQATACIPNNLFAKIK